MGEEEEDKIFLEKAMQKIIQCLCWSETKEKVDIIANSAAMTAAFTIFFQKIEDRELQISARTMLEEHKRKVPLSDRSLPKNFRAVFGETMKDALDSLETTLDEIGKEEAKALEKHLRLWNTIAEHTLAGFKDILGGKRLVFTKEGLAIV